MSQYTPKSYQYIKWAQEFKKMCGPAPTCHICKLVIDPNAPRNSKGQFTLDHLVPLSRGGDPFELTNCAPAHRGCNGRRGNRFEHDPQPAPRPAIAARFDDDTPRTSRCWTGCPECRGALDTSLREHRNTGRVSVTTGYGNTCPRIVALKAHRRTLAAR
ncbi:HNH endonuclease [Rhodococcus fascians]|uniref:HNH endonuclease n=1 Tax=Rhodococcoides fascians TaxID=1828 RepID=UPI001E33C4C1|nr:HNH endonuclease [Rhodococcus fascians]MDJ0003312.1 HNH endonuclease [Rhodococcus fascians]